MCVSACKGDVAGKSLPGTFSPRLELTLSALREFHPRGTEAGDPGASHTQAPTQKSKMKAGKMALQVRALVANSGGPEFESSASMKDHVRTYNSGAVGARDRRIMGPPDSGPPPGLVRDPASKNMVESESAASSASSWKTQAYTHHAGTTEPDGRRW